MYLNKFIETPFRKTSLHTKMMLTEIINGTGYLKKQSVQWIGRDIKNYQT